MRPHLGYLISRYPSISHTFILREVLELRRLGFHIDVASINNPDRQMSVLTPDERHEAAVTFYVKAQGIRGALRAHAFLLFTRPADYLQGLWFSFRLGGIDLRKITMALFYFIEAVMVGEWMRRLGLKHLHVHFATPAATVGLIAARVFGITYSITVHGPDEFYDTPGYLLPQKIAAASVLFTIGLFARSQLMKLCDSSQWSKIELAPLGVDPHLFQPRTAVYGGRFFEIICVGRLVPAKGQHILLHAVALLLQAGRDVRLRLVGDGPDRASLAAATRRMRIEDAVFFEGAVDQDRIQDLYARADIFALASFAEGIPIVLMEAMSMEIPCVSTWITGIPELIRDGVDGLLVAPSDVEGLAAAIARLMDDDQLRLRLGAAGRQRIIDKYTLEHNVARLAAVFDARLGTREIEVLV